MSKALRTRPRRFPRHLIPAGWILLVLFPFAVPATGTSVVEPADNDTSALLRILTTGTAQQKYAGIAEVGRIQPDANLFFPVLVRLMTDEDPMVSHSATYTLEFLDYKSFNPKPGQEEIGVLARAVMDDDLDGHTKKSVIRALGHLGAQACETTPVLLSALQSREFHVPAAAAIALGDIGEKNNEIVDGLMSCLEDSSPEVNYAAASSLERLRIHDERALDAYIRLLAKKPLGTPSSTFLQNPRLPAAKALWEAGKPGQKRFIQFLQSEDYAVAETAADALALAYDTGNNPALLLMEHPDPKIQFLGSRGALGVYLWNAKLLHLTAAFPDSAETSQTLAERHAFEESLEPFQAPPLRKLNQLLKAENPQVRQAARETLDAFERENQKVREIEFPK